MPSQDAVFFREAKSLIGTARRAADEAQDYVDGIQDDALRAKAQRMLDEDDWRSELTPAARAAVRGESSRLAPRQDLALADLAAPLPTNSNLER